MLYIACEYVISGFRKAAQTMLPALDLMKKYEENEESIEFSAYCRALKINLNFCIKESNGILHLHNISEFGTRTQSGRRFCMREWIISSVDGAPYGGRNSDQQVKHLPSLMEKLSRLRTVLSQGS